MLRRHTNISTIIGAGIIGISLIVALNFAEFIGWTRYAIYHLSGQAAADKLAQEQYHESLRLQQAEAEQRRAEEAAKEEQQRAAEAWQQKILVSAWDSFLVANMKVYKQISVVEDARHGDYVCLTSRPPTVTGSLLGELEAKYPGLSTKDEKTKAEDAKRAADFWNYQIQDRLADGFLQWLTNNQVPARSSWSYDDLQYLTGSTLLGMFNGGRSYTCLFPSDIWRANRYQKKLQ